MANMIAVAIGRGKDTETTCTRLASKEAEVRVATWHTTVEVVMQKDGRSVIRVLRGESDALVCLSEIRLNSELADSPIVSADGLLAPSREIHLVPRSLDSDLSEDR